MEEVVFLFCVEEELEKKPVFPRAVGFNAVGREDQNNGERKTKNKLVSGSNCLIGEMYQV